MKIELWEGANKFTYNQKTYLKILEEDNDFEKIVLSIRRNLDIPTEGYKSKDLKPLLSNPYLDKINRLFKGVPFRYLRTSVALLILVYKLPLTWEMPLLVFTIFNRITTPSSKVEIKLQELPINQLPYISININSRLSLNQLFHEIEKQCTLYNDLSLELGCDPNNLPAISKFKNIDEKKMLVELSKKKYSYKKMKEEIESKFGGSDNISFEINAQILSTYKKRFNETLKSLKNDKFARKLLDNNFNDEN